MITESAGKAGLQLSLLVVVTVGSGCIGFSGILDAAPTPTPSSLAVPAPRFGESVRYDLAQNPKEVVRFDVEEPTAEAENSAELRFAFTHSREGDFERSGLVTFNRTTGLPRSIQVGSPDDSFGVRASFYEDPWFFYRYLVSNQFESSSYNLLVRQYRVPLEPLAAFLVWGTELRVGEPIERDLFGFPIRATAGAPDENGRFIVSINVPVLDKNETGLTPEERKFVFSSESSFPLTVIHAVERGRVVESMKGSWLSPGNGSSTWRWKPEAPGGPACSLETAVFERTPPDGEAGLLPFPVSAAIRAAQETARWKTFTDDHPDWYVYSAQFRNRTGVGTNNLVPHLAWILHLGFPRERNATAADDAGFEVWQVGPRGMGQVLVKEEFGDPLPPLPVIPPGGVQVSTLSWLFSELSVANPGREIEFTAEVKLIPSRFRLVQISGFILENASSPLEHHLGAFGCLLEIGRYEPARID